MIGQLIEQEYLSSWCSELSTQQQYPEKEFPQIYDTVQFKVHSELIIFQQII